MTDTKCLVCGELSRHGHMCGGSVPLSNLPPRVYGNYLPLDAPSALRLTPGQIAALNELDPHETLHVGDAGQATRTASVSLQEDNQ